MTSRCCSPLEKSPSSGVRLAVVQLAIFFVPLFFHFFSDYFNSLQFRLSFSLVLQYFPTVWRPFEMQPPIAISVFVASFFPRPSRYLLSLPVLLLPISQPISMNFSPAKQLFLKCFLHSNLHLQKLFNQHKYLY